MTILLATFLNTRYHLLNILRFVNLNAFILQKRLYKQAIYIYSNTTTLSYSGQADPGLLHTFDHYYRAGEPARFLIRV